MEKVELGKTGEQVSQVCLGCMLMGSTTPKDESFSMLDQFVDLGGNFLDTANCYAWWVGKGEFIGDESENLLGEWIKSRKNRNRLFLATKVGARIIAPEQIRDSGGNVHWDRVPDHYQYLSAATIKQAVDDSLRRLQTDYIDLYYAHIDDRVTPMEETLEALNTIVQQGKVRHIACSNFRTWRLERARQISMAHGWHAYTAIQQQYSYFRPKPGADFGIGFHADDELLDYLRANEEVTLIAYSPLLKGIYDDPQRRKSYYNWHLFNTEDSAMRLKVLSKLAAQLGVTNNQLVLAWLLHHQSPKIIPIIGFSKVAQFTENLKAIDIHLTDEQMKILATVTN